MSSPTLIRRQSPRRLFKRRVGMLVGPVYSLCEGLQIGEGGMLIAAGSHALQVGQWAVLTFIIPDLANVVVRAEVRYETTTGEYGFQFLNLTFEAKRAIRHYVAAKSEAEATADLYTSQKAS